MDDYKMISRHQLEEIAQKINDARESNHGPILTEEDERLMDTLRPMVKFLIRDELERLEHKIRNHHHITMSVGDGIRYKENGMQVTETPDQKK